MRILLADDDRTTRLLLTRTLESWGYEVDAVADGAAAWEAFQTGEFRLVLSDWEMPRLDGPSLCARVREWEGPYAYVIMLTSHGTSSHIVEGLNAGADDYVSKPFDPAVLRARLIVARRLLALQDELASKNAELARANSELTRIATTDPLLDVGNRRSFEDAIVHAHGTSRRTGRSYGVLLADIDHFKRVNDDHGHPFGDRVLQRVAAALKASLATSGMLFRYGGEELIAVVTDTDRESLVTLAERLRLAVEELWVETVTGHHLSLTVSMGAALFDPAENISCQVVIDYADASLYHAKQNGRNRVIAWPFARAKAPRTSQF
jgi:diguanylate cyclase (GGDEF)-like protein